MSDQEIIDTWRVPLTPDQRRLAYYKQMAGSFPGPNLAAIAAIVACRMVELEEQESEE